MGAALCIYNGITASPSELSTMILLAVASSLACVDHTSIQTSRRACAFGTDQRLTLPDKVLSRYTSCLIAAKVPHSGPVTPAERIFVPNFWPY